MTARLFGASLLLLAPLLAGCGDGGGESASATDPAAPLVKAGEALEAKVGAPGVKSAMPAADDPDVKAFDAEAEKGLTALGTPALPIDGLDSFDRLCGSAAKITAAYVSAGLGATGSGGLPMADSAKVEQMSRNAERYLPQMFTPLLYSAHCTAVHLPAIETAMADQDLKAKAGAVAQVRGGAYQQIMGLLQMAGDPNLDPGRRKRILDLLAGDSARFATVLSVAQRTQIGAAADSVAKAVPDAKAQTAAIKSGFAQAPCGKLCAA